MDFPVKKAHIRAIGKAKENGAVISFDPNIRLPLWNSTEECRKAVREFIPYADIVKISDNELEFVTGKTKVSEGIEYLFSKGVKLAEQSCTAAPLMPVFRQQRLKRRILRERGIRLQGQCYTGFQSLI